MQKVRLETTPVVFNSASIKVLSFKREIGQKAFSLHWHDRMEFIRIHKGKMDIVAGSDKDNIVENEVWIIPPKTAHEAIVTEEVTYDVLMFDVRAFYNESDICKKYLTAIYDSRARFKKTSNDKEIVACFDKIFSGFKNPTLETTSDIYRFLFLICQKCMTDFSNEIVLNDVKEIIEFIEANFSQKLIIDEIAKKFGYCSAHFYRKFKAATGLAPTLYIKIYRLEQARKLLETGESVAQAAEACGFEDANYFTRCFKAHFGITPTKARKNNLTY